MWISADLVLYYDACSYVPVQVEDCLQAAVCEQVSRTGPALQLMLAYPLFVVLIFFFFFFLFFFILISLQRCCAACVGVSRYA